MPDVDFQNISTVHSQIQPKPVTLASAASVSPVTCVSFISGTVAIATVTPPVTGAHMLCFIFTTTTPVAFTTTGNIKVVVTPIQNVPVFLFYNPLEAKYYAGNSKTN